MLPPRVNGEINVEVKLQAQSLSICIHDLRGDVVCPEFKEDFVVSIIETLSEVLLQRCK